jgi:hypothetical protein
LLSPMLLSSLVLVCQWRPIQPRVPMVLLLPVLLLGRRRCRRICLPAARPTARLPPPLHRPRLVPAPRPPAAPLLRIPLLPDQLCHLLLLHQDLPVQPVPEKAAQHRRTHMMRARFRKHPASSPSRPRYTNRTPPPNQRETIPSGRGMLHRGLPSSRSLPFSPVLNHLIPAMLGHSSPPSPRCLLPLSHLYSATVYFVLSLMGSTNTLPASGSSAGSWNCAR